MNITCGLILTDNKHFLSVKPTGDIRTRDIPKGMQNPGEKNLETVIREFMEETSYDLKPHISNIEYVGLFPYTKQKNLCIFKLVLSVLPDISVFKCTSMYKDINGVEYPEVGDFRYTPIKKIGKFKPAMQEILRMVFK